MRRRWILSAPTHAAGLQQRVLRICFASRASTAASPERSLPGHHGDRFAFEVDVGLATDVDGDAVDGAAGERPWRAAGVVVGDGVAAVASDAQAFATDRELARLGLDLALADLHVAVEERQRADGHAGRVVALLLERRGQDQALAGR